MEFPFRKIVCLGAGYVGGPSLAVMAEKIPETNFYVLDIDESRIAQWNSDTLPIYEKGLPQLIKATRGKNLFFSCDLETHIADCDIIFVCVSTPTKKYGHGKGKAADLCYWESAGRMIAKFSHGHKIVVEKSTVPVKTAETLNQILEALKSGNNSFDVLSNPEFLAEGTALDDLRHPDRVLIGGDSRNAANAIRALVDLYAKWVPVEKIITTNVWSSELSKLVANAFLAQRISSINTISQICEKTGADVREVSNAVGHDQRIGPKFLNASVGFGGSCFKKDILNLVYIAESEGLPHVADYWHSVVKINEHQTFRFANLVVSTMYQNLRNKKITLFGFAFKKDTGDVRETPAVGLTRVLFEEGATVCALDPEVKVADALMEYEFQNMQVPEGKLFFTRDWKEAVIGSHAIVVVTEWDTFKTYDFKEIRSLMETPAFIFDGRNLLKDLNLESFGFRYHGVGC